MNLVQVLIESFRSMAANRLRTALTMLGIVIGIASVVLLLALGDSMQRFIGKQLQMLGTNMVYVMPGGDRTAAQRAREGKVAVLTLDDAEALNALPSLTGAAPALQGSFKVTAGNENASSMVMGVTPAMFTIRNWKVDQGTLFSESDVRASARLVVIGQKVADQFFYRADPLGKLLRIENVAFQVVGVLAGEGRQTDGTDLAEQILVPITAASANLVKSPFPQNVHYINAQGRPGVAMTDAIEDIKEVIRSRHRIRVDDPDDFRVQNLNTIAETANKITAGVALLLGLIGAISLLVGGIGIMNIMLVSVTERTREIGIRMAIGARPNDVLMQFLAEAVVICLAGGLVGIAIAAGGAALITKFADFEVYLTISAVMVACGFATAVGVFFGFYPARRASRLLPVDCLRYE
jgi:putative ABC transport system permease protein